MHITKNSQVVSFAYLNNPINFQVNGNVSISATQMAKKFESHKRPVFWLNLQSTKEFLLELSKVRNLTLADLVQVSKGGINPGTWMHEDVAIEYARWLSPKFGIWCNDRVKEILMDKANNPLPSPHGKYRRKRVETYLPADDVLQLQRAAYVEGYNSIYHLLQTLIYDFLQNPYSGVQEKIKHAEQERDTWRQLYQDRCGFLEEILPFVQEMNRTITEERTLRQKYENKLKQIKASI